MSQVTPDSALAFVESLTPPRLERGAPQGFAPRAAAPAFAPVPARFVPDATKDQAAIAGTEIVTFVKGVSAENRQDIINCSLLAERVADEKVSNLDHVFNWYDEYFKALRGFQWGIQDHETIDRVATEEGIDVHKAALELAATLFAPGASGLQLLKGTLSALEEMNPDSDWITLYRNKTVRSKTVRMQLAVAEMDPDGILTVSFMIFGLSAGQRVTQIVFLKFSGAGLHMKQRASKVVPSPQALDLIRNPVAEMVAEDALNFVLEIPRAAAG